MSRDLTRGFLTLLALAVLTWGELQASILTGGSVAVLMLFAITKAVLILYVFMHIARLWRIE